MTASASGVGHPGHKDAVAGYVLRDFAKADQDWLDDLLRGVSDGAAHLADGDPARFLNAVGLRMAPPRAPKAPKPADSPGAPAAEPDEPARNPLQRLVDRFR